MDVSYFLQHSVPKQKIQAQLKEKLIKVEVMKQKDQEGLAFNLYPLKNFKKMNKKIRKINVKEAEL